MQVLCLAFFNNLTQDQIGRIIGVGGPQVCKIQNAALRKLRSILDTDRFRQPLSGQVARVTPLREAIDRSLLVTESLAEATS